MYDDRMEPIPYDEPTDLVAITVETYTARRSYEIAAEYRRRGVPVILGGVQPTLAARGMRRSTPTASSSAMPRPLGRGGRGCAARRAASRVYRGRPGRPQPGVLTRRDIFEGKGYLPISLVQFSRGCRFACDFCAVTRYFDRKQYMRAHRRDAAGDRDAATQAALLRRRQHRLRPRRR